MSGVFSVGCSVFPAMDYLFCSAFCITKCIDFVHDNKSNCIDLI